MAHQSIYTGDATANTYKDDFSALVMRPPLPGGELTFWNMIPKMADGTEPTRYDWTEEELTQITLALGEDLDTTETEVTFAAGEIEAAGLRAGAILANATDTASTSIENILVTSVDSSTSVTVTRNYGDLTGDTEGTGQAHTSGDDLRIIGYLNYEGSSVAKTDHFAKRDRSNQYNTYSLVDDRTFITGSDMVRIYRGNYPSNWAYQVEGIVTRLERQMEWHALRSPRVARSSTARGSMGGLIWWIKQGTSGSHDPTASITFSYEAVDDGLYYLYNQNGLDGITPVLVVPPTGAQAAAYIHESAQRMDYGNEFMRGLRCTQFMSTLTGQMVPVVISQSLPSDAFLILNLQATRVHFLEGRGMKVYSKELGDEMDDFQGQRWVSELTLEFQRPVDNCYYHTGVTYTRPS